MLAVIVLGASLGGARPPTPECFEGLGGSLGGELVAPAPGVPALQLVSAGGVAAARPELARGALMLAAPGVHLTGTVGEVACVLSRKRGTGFIPTDKSPRPPRLFLTFTVGTCSG